MTTPEPLTAEEARRRTSFSLYRKRARTLISDDTFPPGTVFQTPEGLRAEDEETRAVFDVQGGVYPIRESVFTASYTLDADRDALPAPTEPGLRGTIRIRTPDDQTGDWTAKSDLLPGTPYTYSSGDVAVLVDWETGK